MNCYLPSAICHSLLINVNHIAQDGGGGRVGICFVNGGKNFPVNVRFVNDAHVTALYARKWMRSIEACRLDAQFVIVALFHRAGDEFNHLTIGTRIVQIFFRYPTNALYAYILELG